MKRLLILTLVTAAGVLSTACASKPCIEPGAMPRLEREPPLECRTGCGLPPGTALQPEDWALDMTVWALDCARLHEDCVEALRP